MTPRRILLIGGTGVFGRRLAAHLAQFENIELIVTSRSAAKAEALAATISRANTRGLALDHRGGLAEALARLKPWLVIDASGPFQGAGYHVPHAALDAGAHVIDLADARDYISGYTAALDAKARDKNLVALCGASSTPALSAAAVAALTRGWQRVDTIDIAIAPGGDGEVGPAVIAAILTYVGRPVPVWRAGELQSARGWLGGQRIFMHGLGWRRVAPVETIDAETLGPRYEVRARVAFRAGLESRLEHFGLMALAALRKRDWISGLQRLVPLLTAARRFTRLTCSDTGAMQVRVTGLDTAGAPQQSVWWLLAKKGDGPQVPTLPAAAAVRALLAGALAPGARSAANALTLANIEAEMRPYALTTGQETIALSPGVFCNCLVTDEFDKLPQPMQAFHASNPPVWRGSAMVDAGRGWLARLIARCIGLPPAGEAIPVSVSVERLPPSPGRPQGSEIWTRNFAGAAFSSELFCAKGKLRERFGPLSFGLGLRIGGANLHFPVTDWHIGGLRLPKILAPRSDSREYADAQGRFNFDVRLSLPVLGLLAHYRGWLVPADPPHSETPRHSREVTSQQG